MKAANAEQLSIAAEGTDCRDDVCLPDRPGDSTTEKTLQGLASAPRDYIGRSHYYELLRRYEEHGIGSIIGPRVLSPSDDETPAVDGTSAAQADPVGQGVSRPPAVLVEGVFAATSKARLNALPKADSPPVWRPRPMPSPDRVKRKPLQRKNVLLLAVACALLVYLGVTTWHRQTYQLRQVGTALELWHGSFGVSGWVKDESFVPVALSDEFAARFEGVSFRGRNAALFGLMDAYGDKVKQELAKQADADLLSVAKDLKVVEAFLPENLRSSHRYVSFRGEVSLKKMDHAEWRLAEEYREASVLLKANEAIDSESFGRLRSKIKAAEDWLAAYELRKEQEAAQNTGRVNERVPAD